MKATLIDSMKVHSSREKDLKGYPDNVPDEMLSEGWANRNHGQTLQRLNERGGMGVLEILSNIKGEKLSFRKETQADIDELNLLIDKHKSPQQAGTYGYLCYLDGQKVFVIAENISSAFDLLSTTGKKYSLVFGASIDILSNLPNTPSDEDEEGYRTTDRSEGGTN